MYLLQVNVPLAPLLNQNALLPPPRPHPRYYFILTDSSPHSQELFSFTRQTFTEPLPDARPPPHGTDSRPAPTCPPNSDVNPVVTAPSALGAFTHSQQPISCIARPTSPRRTTATRGCYSRAPPFSCQACGLASLQGPGARLGARGVGEGRRGARGARGGREGGSSATERGRRDREGRGRVRVLGPRLPQPRASSQTQSGGSERMR